MPMMEYYSVFKRKKVLAHVITWMNLEDTMPSEVNPSHNDTIGLTHVTFVEKSNP